MWFLEIQSAVLGLLQRYQRTIWYFFLFGRLFVQRFTLCYQSIVCPRCLYVGVLWPNGWMDQEETCHRGGPRPRPHCVRWGPSSQRAQPPIFGPCLLWPNCWMDQDATWYGGRPWPRPHCVRWEPSSPPKRGIFPHNFRRMSIVAYRSPFLATADHLFANASTSVFITY